MILIIYQIIIINISLYHYLFGIIISLIISFMSYRFIEKPFRNKSKIKLSLLVKIILIMYLFLTSYSLIFINFKGIDSRFNKNILSIYNSKDNYGSRLSECSLYGKNINNFCIRGSKIEPSTILLGDSHASILAHSFEKVFKIENKSFVQFTYDGCPPALNLKISMRKDFKCDYFYSSVLKYLENNPNIKNVIIVARWPIIISGKRFNNELGGIESGTFHKIIPIKKNNLLLSEVERKNIIKHEIKEYLKKIIKLDKQIILMYPIPENGWNVPKTYARYLRFHGEIKDNLFIKYKTFENRTEESNLLLDEISEMESLKKIIQIKPSEHLCKSDINKKCIAFYKNKVLYYDDDHLNIIGADFLIDKISDQIFFD